MKRALSIVLLPLLGGCAFFQGEVPGLPVTVTYVKPVSVTTNLNGRVVVDFGREAFGWLELLPPPGFAGGMQQVVIGEKLDVDGGIDRWAPGNVIFRWTFPEEMPEGSAPYRVDYPPDERNTKYTGATPAIRLPDEIGTVHPFRYAEFFVTPFPITAASVRQAMVHYPMDMEESSFSCSDARLERVYELCKYSILATSFAGLYVDGDRERIPYEADAYLNQLGHYAISSDRALARRTHEYLLEHPTWPTEWKQHSIKIAWADWMWTGDKRSLEKYFDQLSTVKLMPEKCSKREDSLVVSTGETDSKGARDIIDWPRAERDGFDFGKVNAVVNAFHYRNLLEMRDIALALGKEVYAKHCQDEADRVKGAFLRTFIDPKDTLVRDCEGSEHKSLHANAIAVAMGLIDDANHRRRIAAYLDTRGMACSVYFAQYLLEAFFEADCADLAIKYMTAPGDRGWVGMMDFGSTITMEAWNMKAKPNQDLNHAWGAAPLNVISRYLLGVRPLEAGFKRILVAPQLGSLTRVNAVVPTAAGAVRLEVEGRQLKVSVPAPTLVVWKGENHQVGPGEHTFR